MRLHQLKVEYDAEQDRLLMLVATSEAWSCAWRSRGASSSCCGRSS